MSLESPPRTQEGPCAVHLARTEGSCSCSTSSGLTLPLPHTRPLVVTVGEAIHRSGRES